MRPGGWLAWHDARLRWRGYAGIVALLATMGGLSLFSVAGARRTESSYPRFLRAANSSTIVATSFGAFDPKVGAAIAATHGVVRSRTFVAFNVFALVHGTPDFSQDFESAGSVDGEYFDQDRFTATHGRQPEPNNPDEVAVNELAASRYHYRVGERLRLGTYDVDPHDPTFFIHPPAPRFILTATIVGIGVFPDEVLQDDADRLPRMLLTPAYTRRAKRFATYGSQGVVLARQAGGVADFKRAVISRLPSSAVIFKVTSVDEVHGLRAVRPVAVALGAFGVIVGIACLVLGVQAVGRVVRFQRDDRLVLRSLGASPRTIVASAVIGPIGALILGAAAAVLVAVSLSPLMPVGPVNRVETRSGVDVDATVMALGATPVVLVPALAAFA